ncbi:hypothetical protein RAB80_014127 [Fusarium oxysporum f. sp. vasinfectum]|nr:hypothetical protein RAB80_014127 [Fusarium oxysporum f. sp. vasinfectum]KAK2923231.1 hypothetical protein FoTM2_016753 [Fusarium oxysporum f. sp. vasinfectum]
MATGWLAELPSMLDPSSRPSWDFIQRMFGTASHDNVQAQAIVACWEVGARFTVAPETITRVMHNLISTPDPVTIDWLKGSVGFFPKDCAVELSVNENEAGVRFLALAAALVTTIGPYAGSQVLDIELKRTPLKLTEVPPLPVVKDILVALLPRSERCSFTNIVLGYQFLVGDALQTQTTTSQASRFSTMPDPGEEITQKLLSGAPSPVAIARLIDVFRQVARLGDSTVTGITLRIGGSVPWILAFVEWCLGVRASIYMEGRREPVLERENANISIKAIILDGDNETQGSFVAIIHRQTEDITQPLGPTDQKPLQFMIETEGYVEWLLHDLGLKRYGDPKSNKRMMRTIAQAIGVAIPQILSLRCGGYERLCQESNSTCWAQFSSDPAGAFSISPFPAVHTIETACNSFLNLHSKEEAIRFQTLPAGFTAISQLPLVKAHLQTLENICACENCCQSPFQHHVSNEWCLQADFFRSLAFLILDLLAFSLLEHRTSLRLFTSRDRSGGDGMLAVVSDILESGISDEADASPIDAMNIWDWARSLVGHGDIDDEHRSLIMTSKRGQVIYPLLLETFRFEHHGYLRLRVLPGTLRRDGLVYNVVSCPDMDMSKLDEHEHPQLSPSLEVTEARDLPLTLEVSWGIETQDNMHIELYLVVRDSNRPSFMIKENPLLLLPSLADTLLLSECPHNRDAKLSRPDTFCRYAAPWHDHASAYGSHSDVDVIATANSDMLRAFSLSCISGPKVLRGNACIDCCLQVCRITPGSIHILIL